MAIFPDYLTIMLIDLAAGLFILTLFLWKLSKPKEYSRYTIGFLMTGFLGLITALPMVLSWPLPGSYNIAFGEPMLFFSIILLSIGFAIEKHWAFDGIVIFGVLGAIMAIVIGAQIYSLGMTSSPFVAMAGYVLTGLGGLIAAPLLYYPKNKGLLVIATILFVLAALLWLYIGYSAYLAHLASPP
ncbi:MAG: DUF981 domain-containing protein [Candidatus Parvarchaeota archaeon]|nr:DUF981 domain-containing protein [Candidatus Parvarchaeota archaeon]MCW1301915.1 DUF981 domain-containing protein [Candidatus Parvarchaeota archaeon]